ncbi:MAG: hypothetical protein GTN49_13065 [candidate division Zixibacteria bacterium]|nr:hypothetical protein [candidate division Zixibacteria bacterium]
MGNDEKKRACRKWQILVGERALGTISERDRAPLERHLAGCRRCRQALAETERMYRLMEGFELAKAGPFFAARVERALRDEAAAGKRERAPFPLWRWLRAPAFAPVAAAVSAAIIVGVLYFNVWAPSAPKPAEAPAARKVAPPPEEEELAAREETRAPLREERRAREPAPPLAEAARPPEPTPLPGEVPAAGHIATTPKVAEESGVFAADVPPLTGVTGEVEKKKKAGRRPERPAVRRGARGRTTAADKTAAFQRPAASELEDEKVAAPRPERATVRRDARGRTTAADKMAAFYRPALGELEGKKLTAADVEAWMGPRFEAEVERLTGDDAAFVDYVTPNGSLMAYFYELPLEEQRTLLSRLRREAEAAPAADMLFSH